MTDGPWVIDSSVLAKVYLKDEEFAGVAQRLFEGSVELVAPQVILYEIPSAIQAAVRRNRLDPEAALAALSDFISLRLPTLGDPATLPDMVRMAYIRAMELGRRVYDALYVVAAEAIGGRLITADANLYETIKDRVHDAVWIADYES